MYSFSLLRKNVRFYFWFKIWKFFLSRLRGGKTKRMTIQKIQNHWLSRSDLTANVWAHACEVVNSRIFHRFRTASSLFSSVSLNTYFLLFRATEYCVLTNIWQTIQFFESHFILHNNFKRSFDENSHIYNW